MTGISTNKKTDNTKVSLNFTAIIISIINIIAAVSWEFNPTTSIFHQPIAIVLLCVSVGLCVWFVFSKSWKALGVVIFCSILALALVALSLTYPIQIEVRVFLDKLKNGEFIEGYDKPLAFKEVRLKDSQGITHNKTTDKEGVVKYTIDRSKSGPGTIAVCGKTIPHVFNIFTDRLDHPVNETDIQYCNPPGL